MELPSTRFYLVNDRPAAVIRTPDGGTDCVVFSFATGELEPDRSYFGHLMPGSHKDVDVVTETQFEARLAACRAEAGARSAAELRHWATQLCATPGEGEQTMLAPQPFRRDSGDTVYLNLPPSGYRRIAIAVDKGSRDWVRIRLELEPAGRLLTPKILDAEFHVKRELPILPESGMQGHVWYHDVTVPGAPATCEITAQFRDDSAAKVHLSASHPR
jgi:hypothetical protein